MKSINFINARVILLTITIFTGMTSCQKDEITPRTTKQSISVQPLRDGDDEEEAIIMGVLQDDEEVRLDNHVVKLYDPTGNLVSEEVTNNFGEFRIYAAPGEYYFVVENPQGGSLSYSLFTLTVDLNLTLTF